MEGSRGRRLKLANLPTPLERCEALTKAWGGPDIWMKRDDLTGFGLSGNKVRKLEFHLAAALDKGAKTVITCGAVQSNHCRATVLAAARVGLKSLLFLRSPDGQPPSSVTGNHLLDRLAGAECRFVTPDQYLDRSCLMQEAAAEQGDAWVVPEGASDPLGALGLQAGAEELATQVPGQIDGPFTIWHAAGSAGTAAGLVRGVAATGMQATVVGCAVCGTAAEMTALVEGIMGEDRPQAPWSITDSYVGAGYGLARDEELAVQVEVTQMTGLLFDPTYTGKAIYGLKKEIERGAFKKGDTVVFWHTGGGFAAFTHDWSAVL